jgi:dynein heavy chain, axonemal
MLCHLFQLIFFKFKDVEELGRKLGFSFAKGNFHSVSLGQGQEIVAEKAMTEAAEKGHWVVLQVQFQ